MYVVCRLQSFLKSYWTFASEVATPPFHFCSNQLPFGSSCPTKTHLGDVVRCYSCDVCMIEPRFSQYISFSESWSLRPPWNHGRHRAPFCVGICWTLQASDRVRSGEWRRNRPYAVAFARPYRISCGFQHLGTTWTPALFSAVSCFHSGMHSTADVCRFIETAHYRQKVSVMIFTIWTSPELCFINSVPTLRVCLDEDG